MRLALCGLPTYPARRMMAVLAYAGRGALALVDYLGGVFMLGVESLGALFKRGFRWREAMIQTRHIGIQSLPVVLLTGAFIGMVFAAQIFFQFHKIRMDTSTGPAVSIALARELGPIITALMLAGRVGAAMAAEIGTMRVTEQIDALRSLAVHPVDYLVVPRWAAMVVSLPLLTMISVFTGIVCAYGLSVEILGIDGAYFLHHMRLYTKAEDLYVGAAKAFLFAFIIVFVSCYKGLRCEGGAEGVGRSTTAAVVNSSIAILIVNFFATMLLSRFLPP